MFKVPQHLLDRLLCAHCHGYLSHGPVMASDGQQLCGRCHSNLPENDKCRFVRQVAYETVAELLMFPCRYHSNGCQYISVFNVGDQLQHEERCVYKNVTVATLTASRHVKYCHKCNQAIQMGDVYHCLFGHSTCRSCKGDHCNLCQKTIMKEPSTFCKNCIRGCKTLLTAVELARHEVDCEFNPHPCPMCDFCDTLHTLKQHVAQQHPQQLFATPANLLLGNRDQVLYLTGHGQLFRLKFWVVGDLMEFLLQYVGSSDNAAAFKYSIEVLSNGFKEGHRVKKGQCLGWNDTSLGTAVGFNVRRKDGVQLEVKVDILKNTSIVTPVIV